MIDIGSMHFDGVNRMKYNQITIEIFIKEGKHVQSDI